MSWRYLKIADFCSTGSGGTPSKSKPEYYEGGDIPWIKSGDLKDSTIYDANEYITAAGLENSSAKIVEKDSILIAMYGATVGRLAILGINAATNQAICNIRPDTTIADMKYLYYFLRSKFSYFVENAVGGAQPNISQGLIKSLEVPLPSLIEQKRIADILDKAADIRQKREQAVKLADDFLRATFLEMFGDPVANPKRWDVASLLEYGSFKNGMNFTKGESGSVLKCLGVGNFKSLATITCMDNIDEIELNTLPSDDYLLKDGDIVFVRSNGNKALVGRCLTIYPNKEKVTFSGFCIRYRIEKSAITAEYLNFLFRTPSMKRQMLSGGQGANIQNISQGTLSALRIPVPPLEKQQTFSKIVSFHSELMKKLNINIVETNDIFDSISQTYFK
ncbi:restriction endonuclease subunit S [Salmonella enterica]|uniref:restriction endonuclease subunit S n=1 Tax=Salmonella enterica TaxID=28901 RepID=UPI0009B08B6A|nr:restriction endonuclease subunit S [Salmonella enterica]EBS4998616.1 restriction endonuclease subunit S [Salmonella enterica subsp. enterica serovar Havana]EDT0728955.1 restriction endonuclease subunit S [Salmonella enterica subsp. enterica serovar Havana]EDW0314497.1 restriction endonuclease subunit S [Salmonella enterica subsp. enterica serovar Havana]EDW2656797.1 restriction endonuclease subunit S [Salmonella enterica subsp. enterica serovar Havana]EFU9016787.1 restriction endonuclease s